MKQEHQRWIAEALRLGRAKHFDDAYRLASLVICEDATNPQALWLVATMTSSLHERRWALITLLRLQPQFAHAREMLNVTNKKLSSVEQRTDAAIRPLRASLPSPYLTQ